MVYLHPQAPTPVSVGYLHPQAPLPSQHGVEEHTQAPDITGSIVTLLLQHL